MQRDVCYVCWPQSAASVSIIIHVFQPLTF